ncbi:MAG: efflux RND transporter periplasmic adaptor subunit [Alphaproteobacteria bacterium]
MMLGRFLPRLALALVVSGLLWPLSAAAEGELGAIGRLTPKNGITTLSGTPGSPVVEILVAPHDQVKRGDVLMVLGNRTVLETEKALAGIEREEVARSGRDAIAVQKLVVQSAQMRHERAEAELAQYLKLGQNAISEREVQRREYEVAAARRGVVLEQRRLKTLRNELPFKIKLAEARLALAEARFRASEVVAPSDGTILAVEKRVGEHLRGDPVVLMADLANMYVTADVYEGDILKIEPGMKASAKSASLPGPLTGVVERVERLVNTDSKLAKVLIRLDNSEVAGKVVGMEVQVTIQR